MSDSPEFAALLDAISWSNANLHFADCDMATSNKVDRSVTADILRGLEHLGWKLARSGEAEGAR